MLQHDQPDDFVIATGQTHSIREFLEETFSVLELNWKDYVEQDPRYMRPAEVDLLLGDASKAANVLGWKPTVTFKGLVKMMVDADMIMAQRERILSDQGHIVHGRESGQLA
jgi:GDPmannose 4,6-dehydratase